MAAVVADTSSLIALHQIGHLSLVEHLFADIHIPPSVAHEAAPTLPDLPSWIRVREPKHPLHPEILEAFLGDCESDALGLALDINAELAASR